jgi:FAD/FMN-containing dehydrogenase
VVFTPRSAAEVGAIIAEQPSLIPRGAGRSYGDAAFNPAATMLMARRNRFLAFDPATGVLTCEAGVTLADILDTFVPRGWFVPVTPGTKFVTIGGMIAADVHGKNHHAAGSFGDHLESFQLATATGEVVTCSPEENIDLFDATIGGMGLTGVILSARFRLQCVETDRIAQTTRRAYDLEAAFDAFEVTKDATYAVGWIDCLAAGKTLGRSIIFSGEHATAEAAPTTGSIGSRRPKLALPCDLPGWTLNGLSVRAFNDLYWALNRPGSALVGLDQYFYPLDSIGAWNRIYGPRGFVQYQCVIPKAAGREGLRALVARISQQGSGSFLAVLKLLGPGGRGLLSFPCEGYTLALDFPVNAANLRLLNELDAITADHGGRLYLAKDARAAPAMMVRGYPRLGEFAALRARIDPGRRFASALSERLDL